jgi:thymidylate synthase (FAD)
MSVTIVTDRGITHEIVRHRIGCSYSQESTRYVKYDDDDGMEFMTQSEECDDDESFKCVLEHAQREYGFMILKGFKPQIARSVLPNALKADIGMTANFRAWRHFLKLRLSIHAHPSIRNVARAIWCMLPEAVVSDICAGCGCKPYKWTLDGVLDFDGQAIWSMGSGNPPPDYCFPLCRCKD